MAKNTGKVGEFCQSGKVGTLSLEVCSLNGKGQNKNSSKMRFHNEFRSVIGSTEGHMTIFLRFLENWRFFQENNLVFLFLKFFTIVGMPLGNPGQ